MKKMFFLLALLFSVTVAQNAFAAGITPSTEGTTITASTEPTKDAAKVSAKTNKVKFFSKENLNKQLAIVKNHKAGDNYILAIILCAFLGTMGIHRVITGTPISILWYLLTLGGIFGIVPLIDFIMMLIDGNTTRFEGNSSLFACFGGGGK